MFFKSKNKANLEPHLLQMLWTKIDVCHLKSIRPNLKSIGAEKSDSENVAIARALLLSIQHYILHN